MDEKELEARMERRRARQTKIDEQQKLLDEKRKNCRHENSTLRKRAWIETLSSTTHTLTRHEVCHFYCNDCHVYFSR